MTLRQAVKKLDTVLASYVRKWWPRCITCGRKTNQAGHFVPRGNMSTRFHPKNLAGQDVRCNHFLSGNLGVYAVKLDKYWGAGTAEQLIKLGRKTFRWETKQIVELIEALKTGDRDFYEETYYRITGQPK